MKVLNPRTSHYPCSGFWGQVISSLGALRVSAIQSGDGLKVLSPIWAVRPETARRLKQRMKAIVDWASRNRAESVGRFVMFPADAVDGSSQIRAVCAPVNVFASQFPEGNVEV